ncbi:hypothetical protein NSPZN2_70150 [Nitrospira defluvii]|uniref:Alginate export domain-containing protein n=2 Tax=Nitrospira defluvii TaxID=330214 RepID=A0ABN7MHW8_9BACT|nr:hypothetical protein NSPZN2_70150 [Nitrospira defluvii]
MFQTRILATCQTSLTSLQMNCSQGFLIGMIAVGLFGLQCSLETTPAFAQTVEELKATMDKIEKLHASEQEEMRRRLEHLEQTAEPPPAPEPRVRVRMRKPEELRPYHPIVCPGFMECSPEPQLQLEAPKPTTGPGWELELQSYNRFRFNLYDNFSDTRNALGSTAANRTFANGSSCSFDTSCKDDTRLRFSTMRGYVTSAIKRGPVMAVASIDYAGDQFNDGVLLGNDSGSLGAAGQRQWIVNPQLYYLQYDGWAQVRLGRQYAHVGNGIVGHIPRDMIAVSKSWTAQFSTQLNYVYGSTGRSISNQAGQTFQTQGSGINAINQTTQNKVNDANGKEESLEGVMLIFNYNPQPMNRLQLFVWKMFDTTVEGVNKQNQYIDVNGSGRLGRMDYAFELAHLSGTTPVISGSAGGIPGTREDNRAYLAYLDLRYTLPSEIVRIDKDDFLSLGATFGFGSGDNKPNDGKNTNFDSLFVDETSFRYNFLFSDDVHGFNGRGFDTRRGSGFSNITFLQPYVIVKPTDKFQAKVAWTYLRASVAQPAGTGALGPQPVLSQALAFKTTAVGGPTKDVGQEFDVLMDYFVNPYARVFSYFGMFLPGRIYAPVADHAVKYELGLELRF